MNAQATDQALVCSLEAIATADEKIALSFNLENLSNHAITLHYFEPFVQFRLTVDADDGRVEIVQPAYDTGLRRMTLTLETSENAQLQTPIQLVFNPDVEPAGGNIPTLWTLRHVSAPVVLRALVQLDGVPEMVCEAHFDTITFSDP